MTAARTLTPLPSAWQRRPAPPAGSARIPAPRTPTAPVRVAVIAGDPITGQGMAAFLNTRPEVAVLEADRQREAQILLVVVDAITDETFKTMAAAAAACADPPRFVLVGDDLREHQVARAVDCGMVSILARRTAGFERVLQTVPNLRDGRLELPGDAVGWLAERLRSVRRDVLEPNGLSMAGMTRREVEVLGMLADGLDTGEIAERLNYSERTVKNAIYGVMARLNLRNRAHAVAFAIRNGAI
jgi:DNA-binding NarL/FixJ family response regulator